MGKIIFTIFYIIASFFLVWGCFVFVKWDVGMAEWTQRERVWILSAWVCINVFLPAVLMGINFKEDDK